MAAKQPSARAEPSGGRRLAAERSRELRAIQDDLLTPDQATELAEEKIQEIDWTVQNASLDYEIRLVKKRRRERWDSTLLVLVALGFVCSYTIIILIGMHKLSFASDATAVPSVVAAGVLETYGLAKLAIRYFFNDDDMTTKH